MGDLWFCAKSLGQYVRGERAVYGTRFVLASGYFNPLHVGHLRMLEAARRLGDALVVVVNNDEQVGLKGSVPFMGEVDRLEIVSAVSWVDHAVLAVDSDRSVSKTLEIILPDVFANGGDVNREADCREAEACRRLGIEMAFGVGGAHKLRSSSQLVAAARGVLPSAASPAAAGGRG